MHLRTIVLQVDILRYTALNKYVPLTPKYMHYCHNDVLEYAVPWPEAAIWTDRIDLYFTLLLL